MIFKQLRRDPIPRHQLASEESFSQNGALLIFSVCITICLPPFITIRMTPAPGSGSPKYARTHATERSHLHPTIDKAMIREDVFISLVEVSKENWSFGNGDAQYAK
jgi:hypothetical protein